jgi:hypothetical protein
MKQKLITAAIWVLGIIVLGTLVASFSIEVISLFCPKLTTFSTSRGSLLPAIAISSGVLIAILTFARERQKVEIEHQRHKSKVMLERVSTALDTSIKLLRDKNNSRLVWVRAARMLRTAVDLRSEIIDPDYLRAYDLEVERARNELYDALTIHSEETGDRSPLPPQFFYGITDWNNASKTLDEAAIEASSGAEAYTVSMDKLPPQGGLKPLSPRSVIAIYHFLEYPKDYKDPLDAVGDWDGNWDESFGPDQGAKRYVAHTKQKFAVDGKIHERNAKPETR